MSYVLNHWIVSTIIVVGIVWVYRRRYFFFNNVFKPVVCVCYVNDRVGIALKRDLNRVSRKYWRECQRELIWEYWMIAGLIWILRIMGIPNDRRVSPYLHHTYRTEAEDQYVFVFKRGSKLFNFLSSICFFESGDFEVPKLFFDETYSFFEAYRHFFGRFYKPKKGQPKVDVLDQLFIIQIDPST